MIRIYERYAREVVERFDLCPWAERARRTGRVAVRVRFESDASELSPSLAAIEALADEPETEVALLIYPRLRLARREFEQYLRVLRQTHDERYAPGTAPFAMAAFHPEAAPDLGHADRLVPFVRRSPDPTIQLVRKRVLDELHRSSPSGTSFVDVRRLGSLLSDGDPPEPEPTNLRDWVAERNLQTVSRLGAEALEQVFAAIARDRAETYARLGIEPGS